VGSCRDFLDIEEPKTIGFSSENRIWDDFGVPPLPHFSGLGPCKDSQILQSPMLLLAVAAKRWGSPGDRPWNITKCANKIDSYVSTARGKPSMVILP